MTDKPTSPPDRLSLDPRSKFFDSETLERGIGIRFKGTERTNVIEYCISEGWIRVQAGKSNDRHGNPMTIKLSGPVEAWFEDLKREADEDGTDSEEGAASEKADESEAENSDHRLG